jgi:L-galactose dehydrogenase/L-glyceraldehyde 3-phosphate reductase
MQSVEASLRRLGRDSVDLIQYHNPLIEAGLAPDSGAAPGSSETGASVDALESVFHAFQMLQQQGKVRFYGITGLGSTRALHHVVASGGFDTLQACFNLLNPSAAAQTPAHFPFQDFHQLIDHCAEKQIGVIAIRVLAGGALSGSAARHPVAAQTVAPIATADQFAADVARAQTFQFLVDDGYCANLSEAAIRFAIGKPSISTALVGISSPEQLEQAVAAANRGPLPDAALARLPERWAAW